MAGTSNIRWFFLLSILFASLSCVKEESQDQPVDGGEERFAEFDPVVRFGLDTYMGGADDNEPLTKTTYAGDDKTIVLNKVRYERINWNVWNSSLLTKPDDPGYPDAIQIISQTNFTPKNNKNSVSYWVEEISGFTNPGDNSREDRANAKPGSPDDNFYWSRPAGSKDTDKHYFYAVYPTPESSVRPSTKVTRFDLDTSDSDPANHVAYIEGSINKRDDSDLEASRQQKYLDRISYTDGLLGNGQTCYEYLPDMKNAYLYAAAVMPGADAGYKKVPLRFKPLYSAIKLIVTARDAGAKNYRLKRVDLRTDLHNNGAKEGRRDLNEDGVGTALGGSFSTYFKADATSGTTADFAPIDPAADTKTTLADTLKRLFIDIDPDDRKVLGDDVLKLTFLVLPIEQRVMTVEYTFEYMKDDTKGWADPENVVEVHRYLSLQDKTDQSANNKHNEFSDKDWYPLDPATKLYVKSNIPEILYYFDVIMQGDLPRTWKDGSTKPTPKSSREDFTTKDFFEAKDFYAVISYRDSSGFKQPLRWKVTGYRPEGESSFSLPKPASVSWLNLRGDGPWEKRAPFDVDDPAHPGYPYDADYDPWDVVQGQGTKMKDPVDKEGNTVSEDSEDLVGYRNFDTGFYNFYDAGAPDNGTRSWGWVNHGSYIHSTPDGKFVHHENDGVAFLNSTGWKGENGEAYAFDLSSHDIYGVLYSGLKNGDLGTTANCYVVSSPGWYRFPAVYGNAIKGGSDNEKAYKGLGTGDNKLMGWYKDHKAADIKKPWIPYPIKSVSVVWEDATSFVSERNDADTRMDRRPFCETIDGKQYIYFYVDDIAQGNAVVAAKDEDGLIVWSWHIWAVTDPVNSLKTVLLQSNETGLDPYDPLSGDRPTSPTAEPGFNILPSGYNFTSYPTNDDTKRPMQWPFTKKSSVTNVFWKESDLGQNGKEPTTVDARYCDVEFTQYFKGKVVRKVVRRFLQSGVKDTRSDTPGYQWGRKDPMQEGFVTVKPLPTDRTKEHADTTILEPTSFYFGSNANVPTGKVYDNLWNNNIDVALTDSRCDDERNQFPGGSKDRNVEKTIYDPSPSGYVVPNMYAFSAFNPYGTIIQIRFPSAKVDEIAYDAAATYKTDGTGYIDFYAGYNKDADYKRLKDKDYTIRIFFTGRINGTSSAGTVANRENVYLWTSEPAFYGGYHGRSFCTQNSFGTDNWGLNPVTGLSGAEPKDPSNPSAGNEPGIRKDGASQPKWQRSHCNRVRPMLEQP